MPSIDVDDLLSSLSKDDYPEHSSTAKIRSPSVFTDELLPFLDMGWQRFEVLTLIIARKILGWEAARLHAPPGVGDLGIDVLARKTNGELVGFQCKCTDKFTAAQLQEAVEKFEAQRPATVEHLIVVLAGKGDDKAFIPKLTELETRFPHLTIELWDGFEVSERLRAHPDLVAQRFGRYWAQTFCPALLAARPRQLPASLTDFTGRHQHMTTLTELAESTAGRPLGPSVAVIAGTGGSGKSSLAIQAAHVVAGDFPDGAIFINLAGSTDTPVPAAQAVAIALRSLGTADEDLNVSADELSSRLRSVLSGQRVVMILDDAADESQIRLLLPGNGPSLVLVTSRNRLLGLSNATRIDVGALGDDEAASLLARIAGQKAQADEPATQEVARLCGNLPLALRITGNLMAGGVGWNARYLAGQLRDERERLSELHAGDLDVRASFSLSFRRLSRQSRQLFSRLVLIPGPRFDANLAQRLCHDKATQPAARETQRQLRDLATGSLLELDEEGWFRFHDLVRVFAAEQLPGTTSPDDADAALDRTLSSILIQAGLAAQEISPLKALLTGTARATGGNESISFLDTYWNNIAAALPAAAWRGLFDDLQLAVPHLVRYVEIRDHERSWFYAIDSVAAAARQHASPLFAVYETMAIEALRAFHDYDTCLTRIDDLLLRVPEHDVQEWANISNVRGLILQEMYRHEEALTEFERSIEFWRSSTLPSNHVDVAVGMAQHNIATSLRALGRHEQALALYAGGLDSARRLGDSWDEAGSLITMANAYRDAGRFEEAISAVKRAGALYVRAGDRRRACHALNDLGVTYNLMFCFDEARVCFEEHMTVCRNSGDEVGWAVTALNLCKTLCLTDDAHAAISLGLEAQAILQKQGRPHHQVGTSLVLAMAYLQTGNPDEGLTHLHHAIGLRHQCDDAHKVNNAIVKFAEHFHDEGRRDDAAELMKLRL